MTLFLMSFGGCCLIEDNVLPPLSTIISMDDLPPRFHRGGRNPGTLVKQFIGQGLELLSLPGPENVFARETIKDAFGLELHPLLFPAFFTHMERYVRRASSDESTNTPNLTTAVSFQHSRKAL